MITEVIEDMDETFGWGLVVVMFGWIGGILDGVVDLVEAVVDSGDDGDDDDDDDDKEEGALNTLLGCSVLLVAGTISSSCLVGL